MKKIITSPLLLVMFCSLLFTTSCSTDTSGDIEDVITGGEGSDGGDPDTTVEYDLIVNASNANSGERTLDIEAVPGSTVIVNLFFESDDSSGSDDKKMRRVYGTSYTYGDADITQYEFDSSYDLKADGSYDIPSAGGYQFIETLSFTAPALDQINQYNFWTTSGRGDFRDVSKRNSISGDAYGTVTIKGANVEVETDIANANSVLNQFTQTILFAPTADGTSESFISLYDEQTHTINEGIEKMAFWDFGYFYGANTGASFYSVYDYPEVFKIGENTDGSAILGHVSEFVQTDLTELNRCYFAKSTMNFDAVTTSSDLDAIDTPSSERVQGLQIGDVVEFVDQYGNKGLIKITDLDPGFNQGDSITFDVKVQLNALPVKL